MVMKQPDFRLSDFCLARAEVVLRVPGLFTPDGERRTSWTEQARDIIEAVAQFMCGTGRNRSAEDVARRIAQLLTVYGASADDFMTCLLYTSPSPRDAHES
eukprot:4492258-Prymnesium_polylepis.1